MRNLDLKLSLLDDISELRAEIRKSRNMEQITYLKQEINKSEEILKQIELENELDELIQAVRDANSCGAYETADQIFETVLEVECELKTLVEAI